MQEDASFADEKSEEDFLPRFRIIKSFQKLVHQRKTI